MQPSEHFFRSSITRKNLPFCISWVIVFIWLYAYFLPFGGFRFESQLYNLKVADKMIFTAVWLVVTPLLTGFFDARRYVPHTVYSVLGALVSFLALRFSPSGLLSNLLLAAGSACIGHIFASCCYAFFMLLNNTEKFYSMLHAVLAPKLLLLLKPLLNRPDQPLDPANWLILVLLLALFGCSLFFRRGLEGAPVPRTVPPPPGAYSLMPLVFAVLCLNDVVGPAVIRACALQSGVPFAPYYFAGIALGIGCVFYLEKHRRTDLYHMLNFSFASAVLGFVAGALSLVRSAYAIPAFLLFGLAYAVGLVNIYYLAGFLAKRFGSLSFYRAGIALSSAYYFLGILAVYGLDRWSRDSAQAALAAAAFGSALLLVLFLFLTPYFQRNLSTREWMDDTYREDITGDSRLRARLREYRLTPREAETCELLLQGLTLRQISAVMAVSFSTVNTYCGSIYKKLGINSRTELLLLLRRYSE